MHKFCVRFIGFMTFDAEVEVYTKDITIDCRDAYKIGEITTKSVCCISWEILCEALSTCCIMFDWPIILCNVNSNTNGEGTKYM